MAAGERKRYRNREFEDLDYDFDGVRRGFTDSRGEYQRAREGDFAYELGAAGGMRVRERVAFNGGYHSGLSGRNSVRQKGRGLGELLIESDDVMGRGFMESSGEYERTRKVDYANEWGTQDGLRIGERDAVNGRYSSGSGEGPSVRRGLKSGELSSESGTHLKSRGTRSESPKLESRNTLLVENKKRKFTPIVWDREHKEVSTSSKIRASLSIGLPPPPPLPKNYRKSSNYISDGFVKISPVKNSDSHSSEPLLAEPIVATEIKTQISSVKDNESHFLEPSLAKPRVAVEIENHISPASGSAVDISFPHREQKMDNYPDKEVVINSDYFPAVNILSSRWAGNADSPPDEGEIADDEDIHMSRKVTISRLVETSRRNKSLTPDYPELKREGLERSRRRLSGSDEDSDCRRSTSIDAYSSDDLEKDEKEHGKDEESATQFQNDSDDESDKRCMPEPPQRSIAMLEGCRSVDEYKRLNRINEGTYGVVYRAEDKKRGEIVALKKVKLEKEREGFPLTALREINILLSFHHPSIVDVKEVVVGSNLDNIFMAMEYMEHDVKALMEAMKQPFSQSEVKCLMLQLLEGVKYLHDNWVLHRDLKTSNLLMNNRGELKICDFGLARQYGSPLKPYTHLVVTLWYRAPELLLGQKEYSTAIDMWSLGCIMAELLSKEPLFNGKTEVDQLDKIFRMLGTPNETIWPGFSKLPGIKVNFVKHQYNQLRKKFRATTFTGSPVLSDTGLDLLNKLLTYDPEKRIIADEALKHDWFREIPLPKSKEFMPTFPAQNAQDRRFRKVMKSPDPLKEQLLKEMEEREVMTGALFGLGKCA